MASFMLGAISTRVRARSIDAASSETMSSHRPVASLASMSMVQGATRYASNAVAARMCCGSAGFALSHGEVSTGRPASDWKTSGATKRCASGVMATVTSAPACASVLTAPHTL